MNLQEHYAHYSASLSWDLLEDTELYAKITPTKDTHLYKNIHEYLVALVKAIRGAIDVNNVDMYRKMLRAHQFALTHLFRKMVDELLEDNDKTDGLTYFYLARDIGWHWFKFSGIKGLTIKLKDGPVPSFTVVPRYTPENMHLCAQGFHYIDADEARYLSTQTSECVKAFFLTKEPGTPRLKFVKKMDTAFVFSAADDFNSIKGVVQDWSLSLEGSYV